MGSVGRPYIEREVITFGEAGPGNCNLDIIGLWLRKEQWIDAY